VQAMATGGDEVPYSTVVVTGMTNGGRGQRRKRALAVAGCAIVLLGAVALTALVVRTIPPYLTLGGTRWLWWEKASFLCIKQPTFFSQESCGDSPLFDCCIPACTTARC